MLLGSLQSSLTMLDQKDWNIANLNSVPNLILDWFSNYRLLLKSKHLILSYFISTYQQNSLQKMKKSSGNTDVTQWMTMVEYWISTAHFIFVGRLPW
jgi:hypothetical protein